jgi:hypothetical protein
MWKPINSAPTDGSFILIRGGSMEIQSYEDDDVQWLKAPMVVARFIKKEFSLTFWEMAIYDGYCSLEYENPTEWRELPE